MAKIHSPEFWSDWQNSLRTLALWGENPGNLQGNGLLAPTRQAVQRAIWLAAGMIDLGQKVDRIRPNNDGGILFERLAERKTWRINFDGATSIVQLIGDEQSRHTTLTGALP